MKAFGVNWFILVDEGSRPTLSSESVSNSALHHFLFESNHFGLLFVHFLSEHTIFIPCSFGINWFIFVDEDEASRPTSSSESVSNTAASQVRLLPKWQIVGSASASSGSKPHQRPSLASLKPGSAPQKATLLTKNGPQDVSADISFDVINERSFGLFDIADRQTKGCVIFVLKLALVVKYCHNLNFT